MERSEVVAAQIVAHITSSEERTRRLLMPGGTRFIVCGPSGSGKSRAIDLANQALPEDEQITESGELRSIVAPEEAAAVVDDRYLAYENSQHIGFSVWRKERGMAFERHGLKVFWLV